MSLLRSFGRPLLGDKFAIGWSTGQASKRRRVASESSRVWSWWPDGAWPVYLFKLLWFIVYFYFLIRYR
jgi:hypothetical protein